MPFQVKTVALPPGGARCYESAEWRDALVLVASGALEVESTAGARQRFSAGATLWLARLSLRALHNPGVGGRAPVCGHAATDDFLSAPRLHVRWHRTTNEVIAA